MGILNFPLAIIIISSTLFSSISPQCLFLLNDYYSCRYLNFEFGENLKDIEMYSMKKNTRSYTPWNHTEIKFAGNLTNQFYTDILGPKNTSSAAMDLFHSLYTELSNCSTDFCRCSKNRAYAFDRYAFYFMNDAYFNYTKELFTNVTSTLTLRSVKDMLTDFAMSAPPRFMDFEPSLVDFCVRYDYSHLMITSYNETAQCDVMVNENRTDMRKCFEDILGDDKKFNNDPASFSKAQLKAFTRCVFDQVKCPLQSKLVFKFHFLAMFPHIIEGDIKKFMLDEEHE